MNPFKLRFSWMPAAAFVMAVIGYLLAKFIGKEVGFWVITVSIFVFVIGNILIVFFPREEDSDFFNFGNKMMVVGFTVVAASFAMGVIGVGLSFKDGMYYFGVFLMVLGIFLSGKR